MNVAKDHYQRLLDQTVGAEIDVIGCILFDQNSFYAIPSVLERKMFYVTINGQVFEILKNLILANKFSFQNIMLALTEQKILNKFGGEQIVRKYQTRVDASTIVYSTKIIIDGYRRRLINEFCLEASQKCEETPDKTDTIFARLRDQVNKLEIIQDEAKRQYKFEAKDFDNFYAEYLNNRNNPQTRDFIKTDYVDIDKYLTIERAQLTTIAGGTGHGKTSFSISLWKNIIAQGFPAMYFTFEVEYKHIVFKTLARMAGTSYERVKNGDFGNDMQAFHEATEVFKYFPGTIIDKPNMSVDDIIAEYAKYNLQNPEEHCEVIFIDHFHCLPVNPDRRRQEYAEMVRKLKMFALSEGIYIFILAQFNKEADKRNDKRPNKNDILESAEIQHYSDNILLVFRKDQAFANNPNYEPNNMAEIIVDKNRHGAAFTAHLRFDTMSTGFENLYLPKGAESYEY